MSAPKDAISPVLDPAVSNYLRDLARSPDDFEQKLEAHAAETHFPLVGRASGRWLELLTRSIGGKRVFEFGSGWGYSAYWFARAVGADGEVLGSEKDNHELVHHEHLFAGHPLKERISIHQGDALEIFANTEGAFDVVFIDVHKGGYIDCVEAALPRLRTGGMVLADNVMWGGRTARPPQDDATRALQRFNKHIFDHPDLLTSILPAGDGLSVSLKR